MTIPMMLLRRATTATLAGALLLVLAQPVAARQVTPATPQGTDGTGWKAWVGCWEPMNTRSPGSAAAAADPKDAGQMVCVLPTERDRNTVEIATVLAGQVAERLTLAATGAREERTIEDCTGWESATWAADGQRIYTRSSYSCEGGVERRASGVLAMAAGGQWFDVQSITVGDYTATRTLRYRAARPATGAAAAPVELPAEIAEVLATGQTLAARNSRFAAAAPIFVDDVIEAARYLDTPTLEAWLVEQAQGFAVDARQLIELADAEVPADVIDLMVALSFPEAFAIDRVPHADGFDVAEAPRTPSPRGTPPMSALERYRDPFSYRYYQDNYGFGSSLYSPFHYSPYGYGAYGYGWYTGGTGPVVIVVKGTGEEVGDQPRGHVVKGRGYTRTNRGDPTRNDAPRWADPAGSSRSPARAGSGNPGAGVSQPASGSGSGSGSGRTAKPRDPKTGT
jgi:hypothetical protein